MNKAIEKQINEIYKEVWNKIFTKSDLEKLMHGDKSTIFLKVSKLESSDAYNIFAKKFSEELAKKGIAKQRGLWKKYYAAAKKLNYTVIPTNFKNFEFSVLTKAIQHNFEMIKSIPSRTLEVLNHKYTSTLIEEVFKGNLGRGSFERLLASHGHKNAKLIARTESSKLQTAITEYRALSLGSIIYKWRASNDIRTRPSHKAMNNVIVFWRQSNTEKPYLDGMYGNAGEFPNCRCSAQPLFDEHDLKESNYKVYDYTTKKIISMTKKKLLAAISNGSL